MEAEKFILFQITCLEKNIAPNSSFANKSSSLRVESGHHDSENCSTRAHAREVEN